MTAKLTPWGHIYDVGTRVYVTPGHATRTPYTGTLKYFIEASSRDESPMYQVTADSGETFWDYEHEMQPLDAAAPDGIEVDFFGGETPFVSVPTRPAPPAPAKRPDVQGMLFEVYRPDEGALF